MVPNSTIMNGHLEPLLDDLDERIARDGAADSRPVRILVGSRPCPGGMSKRSIVGHHSAKNVTQAEPHGPISDHSHSHSSTERSGHEWDRHDDLSDELSEAEDLTLTNRGDALKDRRVYLPDKDKRRLDYGTPSPHASPSVAAAGRRGWGQVRKEEHRPWSDPPVTRQRPLANGLVVPSFEGLYANRYEGSSVGHSRPASSMSRNPATSARTPSTSLTTPRHTEAFEMNRPPSSASFYPGTFGRTRHEEGSSAIPHHYRPSTSMSTAYRTTSTQPRRRAHIEDILHSAPAKLRELSTPSRLERRPLVIPPAHWELQEQLLKESLQSLARSATDGRRDHDFLIRKLTISCERALDLSALVRKERLSLSTDIIDDMTDNLINLTMAISRLLQNTDRENPVSSIRPSMPNLTIKSSQPTSQISIENVIAHRSRASPEPHAIDKELIDSNVTNSGTSPTHAHLSRYITSGATATTTTTTNTGDHSKSNSLVSDFDLRLKGGPDTDASVYVRGSASKPSTSSSLFHIGFGNSRTSLTSNGDGDVLRRTSAGGGRPRPGHGRRLSWRREGNGDGDEETIDGVD